MNILKNYFRDVFIMFLDVKWCWILLIFVMGFILIWMVFVCFYLLFSYINGDFLDILDLYDYDYCIINVYDFIIVFFFFCGDIVYYRLWFLGVYNCLFLCSVFSFFLIYFWDWGIVFDCCFCVYKVIKIKEVWGCYNI